MSSNPTEPRINVLEGFDLPNCQDIEFLSLVSVARYWAQELGVDTNDTLRQLSFAVHCWLTESFPDARRKSGDPKFLEASAVRSERVLEALSDVAYQGARLNDALSEALSTVDVFRDAFGDWRSRNGARPPRFWFPKKPTLQNFSGDGDLATTKCPPYDADPRELELAVDVRANRITLRRPTGEEEPYPRSRVTGKGTRTWELLVLFAKHYGDLQGKNIPKASTLNSAANRRHLGEKLVESLNLRASPFSKGDAKKMVFKKIYAEREGIDAMERRRRTWDEKRGGTTLTKRDDGEPENLDDAATQFLANHGEDMPPIK